LGGLKQQGPCKLKVGGGAYAPSPGSAAYDERVKQQLAFMSSRPYKLRI